MLEKEFAENLFKKIANYRWQAKEIEITEGMRVTVLSIFWRTLLTTQHRENKRTAEDNVVLQQFLSSAKQQIKERAVTMPIHITPFIGDPPLYGFPTELTYLFHRMVGDQDICFFDDPHRYYAVFKLPFMFFHIRSPEWGTNLDPESSFSGKLKLDKIKHLPSFLEDHIYWLAQNFNEALREVTQQSIDIIERDLAKENRITGAHKSMAASIRNK
ncbi:hypothetical protein D0838_05020 [Bordetella avium]|nr:hypothetical protein D0838_05020 [Bordetella avium]